MLVLCYELMGKLMFHSFIHKREREKVTIRDLGDNYMSHSLNK